jgi:hypothetical protein
MTCGSPKELARRRSGADDIMLLWYPACARLEVFIRNVATGIGLHLEVGASRGLDAFHHPYAYAARGGGVLGGTNPLSLS